jgi:hypothetical protein
LFQVFKEATLWSPSSTVAERSFNHYKKNFEPEKESCLEDNVESSMKLYKN